MTIQATLAAGERPLDILGISEPEEQAYRWILTHPGSTVQELARTLALTPGKTQRLLDTVESKGLATCSPERPRRYLPVPPDIALKALSLRRQEGLQRADAVIRELQEQTASRRQGEQELTVELITSREIGRQIFEQMHSAARREVVCMIRAPILVSKLDVPDEQDQYAQRQMQEKGVHYRSIADEEFLALPGAVQRTWKDMKAGEEVRVVSRLPFKMLLVDRRIALVPLDLEQPYGPSLLVRSSALLDALYALFDILWQRAAPLSFTRAGDPKTENPDSRLPEGAEELLSLLAAGLNDKKIAHELGLSLRTLYRRIADLMKSLDARTRFQFGWLAALQLSGMGRNITPQADGQPEGDRSKNAALSAASPE